jgi:hypothetical protein
MYLREVSMNADDLSVTHCKVEVKTKEDLFELVSVFNKQTDEVMIRNIYHNEIFPLSDVARGPFVCLLDSEGSPFIKGFTIAGEAAKIRLIENGVVELDDGNPQYPGWRQPSLSGVRIYVPMKPS